MCKTTENRILYVLRLNFWNTAKAALESLMGAYWDQNPEFNRVCPLIEAFIKAMDDIL